MTQTLEKRNFTALAAIALAILLRVLLIPVFSILGDEWYTVESAKSLGSSFLGFPYLFIVRLCLNFFGIQETLLRLVSIAFGVLGVAFIYSAGKLFSKQTALYAALLAATSSYLILDSLEIRYYSFFFAGSAALLLYFLKQYEKHDLFSFIKAGLVSVFALTVHFNLLFLAAGFFSFRIFEYFLKTSGKNKIIILAAAIGAGVIFITMREQIFGLAGHLGYKNAELLNSGFYGWRIANFVKLGFTAFSFVFGYNINPLNLMCTLPVIGLYLILGVKGIVWIKTKTVYGLSFAVFFLVLPLVLLFLVAEPLATERFFGILGPKYGAFSYAPFILIIAAGLASFESAAVRNTAAGLVLLLNVFYFGQSFAPQYTYYVNRYVNYRDAAALLEKSGLDQDTLFIVDPRSQKSFDFYYGKQKKNGKEITPWGINEVNLENFKKVVLVTDNWKEYVPSSSSSGIYMKMMEQLNASFDLKSGYVYHPFFLYIFEKSSGESGVNFPAELYGFEYADLRLPAAKDGFVINGSFSVPSGVSHDLLKYPIENVKRVSLIFNLEKSLDLPSGTKVGALKWVAESETKQIDLIKNRNVFDVFDGMDSKNDELSARHSFMSWQKNPFWSTSRSYKGAYRSFPARLYRIDFDVNNASLKQLTVEAENGGILRVWGVKIESL